MHIGGEIFLTASRIFLRRGKEGAQLSAKQDVAHEGPKNEVFSSDDL
jgi:hypothetical protein